jgi:tetratricopeptide (TPR) repeat protein
MYTDTGRLDEAQSVLLVAGRIAPREGNVYRWLGEVLLRRGDAERAEKVLEKAIQFGVAAGSQPLLEHARALISTQRTSGLAAVADAVQRAIPPLGLPRRRQVEDVHESETAIRKNDDVKAVIAAAFGQTGTAAPLSEEGPQRTAPFEDLVFSTPTRGLGFDIVEPPEGRPEETETAPRGRGAETAGPVDPMADTMYPKAIAATANFDRPSERRHEPPAPSQRGGYAAPAYAAPSGPMMPASAQSSGRMMPASAQSSGRMMPAPAQSSERMVPAPAQSSGRLGARIEPPVSQRLLDAVARPMPTFGGAPIPEARDVLEALQIAGVYEPEIAGTPQAYAWTAPERVRRWFSTVTLLLLAVGLVGGGTGTFYYVTSSRAKEHVRAEQLLVAIDKQLQSSDARILDPSEKAISRTFELDSRSPHAALTWLHERALVGLLKGGSDLAFEDAVQRAKAVGVDDKRIAVAHVASFLYQGDTAGSAATVAKWDTVAQDDPWFQLLAGATFERAGDPRALERYAAAVRLDPELVIAQMLLIRATSIEGDTRRAAELAKDFRARFPDRVEGFALIALAWTRDPLRGDPPAEVKDVMEKGDALPPALRAVPHAARAILALHRGAIDEAKPPLQKALEVADSPGIATWLGGIALATGDENLARKAALAAVSYSAVYAPARVLAARVALLGARLDEALKATEDLPPTWADVAVVTAAASYEKLDGERIARAFDAVPEDARRQLFVVPLARGQALLGGNLNAMNAQQALDMADDEAPWADIVAMDWALDAGDVELAKKIAERWKGEMRAMRAVRLARLHRYDGKLDEADKYSRLALEAGTVTIRSLTERIFTLVALKRDTEALALFKAYPNVGGPLAKWLRAYVTAAHGKTDEARAIVSQEDPPPNAAPMAARIIAASAYAMMKDTRHGNEYTRPIVQAGFANPDVAFAAEKLGIGKIGRPRTGK